MKNQIQAMKLISQKKKTAHLLHLVLTVITMGLWLVVWVLVGVSNSLENSRIDRKLGKLGASDDKQ